MLSVRAVLVLLLTSLIFAGSVYASTYVDVEDNDVYIILSRLESEGVITSGLLDTKPISRKDAFRLLHEAESNSTTRSEFIKALIRSLKEELGPETAGTVVKPLDKVYAGYVYTDSGNHILRYSGALENEQALNHNNNGDIYKRGSNERIGFTSRLEDWGPLSLSLNPEFRYPHASYTGYPEPGAIYSKDQFALKKAYAVLGLGWDIIVGKDSQWWGPGYNSALVVSNNAEPFTMVKLTNPDPVRLPWILDSLGPFRFTFFITRLDKERPVSEPYLYGMRFDLKPSQYIDIGFEKTAIIGGTGRPQGFNTWFDSLTFQSHGGQNYASANYVNIDDQRAGLDFKVTIPWHVQPAQIYLEADGEDTAPHGRPYPYYWALLGGVYLPRIAGADRFDLRLEYTTTRGYGRDPYVWYTNSTYTSYTYQGNVIGDYIGTDSNDMFAQVSYLMPERNARLFLAGNREEHNLHIQESHETLYDLTLGLKTPIAPRTDLTAHYSHGWLRNVGNVYSPSQDLSEFGAEVSYRF